MRGIRARTAVLLLAVFAAGGLSGAAVDRWLGHCPRPPAGPAPFGPAGPRGLNLSPEQGEKARAIGDRHRPELEAIRQEVMPRVLDIHDRMQRELRAILTPSQRNVLDRAVKRRGHQPPPDILGHGRPGGPPPPEAVQACAGSKTSARCRIDHRGGALTGICRAGPGGSGPLACVPLEGSRPLNVPPRSPATGR
ncbi:MAG: periplasmic heavy metal sensor [Proteobacteria bacterium]|nr:periplasmic heavy metal sensor [Pseudomonadota bacterium]